MPTDWNQERIAAETASVRDAWSELLLRQHLLVGARDDLERAEQLRALTKLHLDLREYEAAIYYGEQRKELLRTSGVTDRWSELMILLAKHQRADKALSRGRLSEEYVQESITLAVEVNAVDTAQSPNATALQSLVLSKIESDSGDKAAAERLLDRVDLAPVQDETVIDLAFQQFDHFYGLLGGLREAPGAVEGGGAAPRSFGHGIAPSLQELDRPPSAWATARREARSLDRRSNERFRTKATSHSPSIWR